MGAVFAVLVFWAVVGGLVGYALGNSKGRGSEGFWLGFLLGFIGWIIVAVMNPSEDVAAERAATITAAVQAATISTSSGPTRECPWCAERIKAAARVCRYCGRNVDPLEAEQIEKADLDYVRDEFPEAFDRALPFLETLPSPPAQPAAWLRELSARIAAGSPPEAAASRIPLDWSGPLSQSPPRMPVTAAMGDPATVGDYPEAAREFPTAYDEARIQMASLTEQPLHPGAWLRELCVRIDAGSPPEAAAARIPLDYV